MGIFRESSVLYNAKGGARLLFKIRQQTISNEIDEVVKRLVSKTLFLAKRLADEYVGEGLIKVSVVTELTENNIQNRKTEVFFPDKSYAALECIDRFSEHGKPLKNIKKQRFIPSRNRKNIKKD